MVVSEGRWKPYRHLIHLDNKLLDIAQGTSKRLMVFMPPRHGKSEMISKYFPAWFMMNNPDKRIILTSYGAEFASGWGRKVRELMAEHGPELFHVNVDRKSSAAARWNMEDLEGEMITAGVGVGISGRGADVLIIDDPVKDDKEAASKTYRDRAWEWYLSTASTRLSSDGAIILVMTRWHTDDLAGRLLAAQEDGGDEWEVVNFPAIAEDSDILGRETGDPLCPEMFPLETLKQIRHRQGSYWWSSLYQQRPSPAEGGTLKRQWFRYYTGTAPTITVDGRAHNVYDCTRFATVDLAASLKTNADYTVIGVWAIFGSQPRKIALIEMVRERMAGPDITPAIKSLVDRWSLDLVGVESTGMQLALVQQMQREGLPIRELKADRDKVSRAIAGTPLFEAGRVFFPMRAHWLSEFEDELLSFPTGAHDDQVDVVSYACQMFREFDFGKPFPMKMTDRGETKYGPPKELVQRFRDAERGRKGRYNRRAEFDGLMPH